MKNNQPTLIHMFVLKCKERKLSQSSTKKYIKWVRDYIDYLNKEHPRNFGERKIKEYLSNLISEQNLAHHTVRQAESAIRFLYRHLLKKNIQSWDFKGIYRKKSLLEKFFRL